MAGLLPGVSGARGFAPVLGLLRFGDKWGIGFPQLVSLSRCRMIIDPIGYKPDSANLFQHTACKGVINPQHLCRPLGGLACGQQVSLRLLLKLSEAEPIPV